MRRKQIVHKFRIPLKTTHLYYRGLRGAEQALLNIVMADKMVDIRDPRTGQQSREFRSVPEEHWSEWEAYDLYIRNAVLQAAELANLVPIGIDEAAEEQLRKRRRLDADLRVHEAKAEAEVRVLEAKAGAEVAKAEAEVAKAGAETAEAVARGTTAAAREAAALDRIRLENDLLRRQLTGFQSMTREPISSGVAPTPRPSGRPRVDNPSDNTLKQRR